jgi:hypothetical protein
MHKLGHLSILYLNYSVNGAIHHIILQIISIAANKNNVKKVRFCKFLLLTNAVNHGNVKMTGSVSARGAGVR